MLHHRGLALGLAFGVGVLGAILVSGEAPLAAVPEGVVEPPEPVPVLTRERVREDGVVAPRAPAPLGETTNRSTMPQAARTELRVFACATAARTFVSRLEKEFEAANRNLDVTITTRTDRDCIDFLLMHDADLAIVSSPLSLNERSRGLRQVTLGHFLAVAVVHPSNRVDSVSAQQLERLRTTVSNWADVGGDQIQVQPVCHQPTRLDDFVGRALRFEGKASGIALRMRTPQEILAYVANEPRALGLVPWRQAQDDRTVRVLEIYNAKPTVRNLKSGFWPLGATLRLVTKGDPDGAVRRFTDFLASERARRVLRETLELPR